MTTEGRALWFSALFTRDPFFKHWWCTYGWWLWTSCPDGVGNRVVTVRNYPVYKSDFPIILGSIQHPSEVQSSVDITFHLCLVWRIVKGFGLDIKAMRQLPLSRENTVAQPFYYVMKSSIFEFRTALELYLLHKLLHREGLNSSSTICNFGILGKAFSLQFSYL